MNAAHWGCQTNRDKFWASAPDPAVMAGSKTVMEAMDHTVNTWWRKSGKAALSGSRHGSRLPTSSEQELRPEMLHWTDLIMRGSPLHCAVPNRKDATVNLRSAHCCEYTCPKDATVKLRVAPLQ